MSQAMFRNVRSAHESARLWHRLADEYAEPLGDKFRARCLREWRKAMAVCRSHIAPPRRRPTWH